MKKKVSVEALSGVAINEIGLTATEVAQQIKLFGNNEIVERTGNPLFELVQDTLKDPMIWFLIVIGGAFYALGEKQEAIILFVAIIPLLLMDAVLHWRTQASTASLKGQLSSRARVVRDGHETDISSHEIVPGDLVLLSAGRDHFLPADGVFESAEKNHLSTELLQIDESVLTGEAFPIVKKSIDSKLLKSSGDTEFLADTEWLGFAGTRVLTGKAKLRVLATGKKTLYGEIVQSVSSLTHERTNMQKAVGGLVKGLIYSAGVICVVLALVRYYQGYGWLDAFLSAATLAIAAIPEEFPVVFAFYLGVGVYRLAKKNALVRRAVSIENIGRVSTICTDKTGTLTFGQLNLVHLDCPVGHAEAELLEAAGASSDPRGSDPVDLAIQEFLRSRSLSPLSRERVFPFTEDRKRESVLARTSAGDSFCFMKGAPESVIARTNLSSQEIAVWRDKTSGWAKGGHKVLACARKKVAAETQDEPNSQFEFLGLLAFEDPPREGVIEAITYARNNGIHVVMITGDHPETASAIARDVNLGMGRPRVISAEDESEKFEEAWLKDHPDFLKNLDVIARCSPLQKLRVVQALKLSGEIVAVTGDGVNDVPALKAADIGIAMGVRGTRSAREVSSIILADDDFKTIVNAIMEGRQLFTNLRNSFEYLLLFHIPFVLTAALIPLLGYPLLYRPIHIVWLELLIHPTALFAFQQQGRTNERTAPNQRKSFFSRFETWRLVVVGLLFTVVILYSYLSGLNEDFGVGHARAKALALLVLWSAGLTLVLSRGKTFFAQAVVFVTAATGVLMIQNQWLSGLLNLSPLHFMDWTKTITLVASMLFLYLFVERISESPLFQSDTDREVDLGG